MKLLFLDSEGFLSLSGQISFEKDNNPQKRVIVVGPNNVGKTNVARALKFVREVCEHTFIGDQALSFVNKYDDKREFKLKVGFRLDKEEKDDFDLFLKIYTEFVLENISNLNNKEKAKKLLLETLRKLFQFTSASIVIHYVKGGYPSADIEFDVAEKKIKLDSNRICRTDISEFSSSKNLKEWFREEFLKGIKSESLLNFILGGGCLFLEDIRIQDKEEREKFSTFSHKYNYPRKQEIITIYWFLLHLFASHIILLDEIRTKPETQIGDDKFKEKMETPFYYRTGEELALFLYRLKNSKVMEDREIRYPKIRNLFKNFTGLKFDVSHTLSSEKESTHHKLDIWLTNGETQISIDYAGSGLLEILNILSVIVGNRNCVIVLDEPALHLHPSKQREFISLINKITKESNNQFIIITHSPYFIEADSLEDVLRFDLEDGKTKIYPLVNVLNQLVNVLNQKDRDKVRREFALNPHYKNMLFAKGVIIVEGETEEISIPFLLRKKGLSLEKYSIEVLNSHSDTNFEMPVKVAEALNIPYVIVCDSKAFSNNKNATLREHVEGKVWDCGKVDFVCFLKDEFIKACERIPNLKSELHNTCKECEKEKCKWKEKPLKTMMILREIKDEEINASDKIEQLANFVREKLLELTPKKV